MTTYTSQPDSTAGIDATIISSAPTTNYSGVTPGLGIGEWNGGAEVDRTLIKFDLSSIPSNATIISATLSLWYKTDLSSNTRDAKIYRSLRAWVEAEVTHNVFATLSNWTTAGAGSDGNDTDLTNVWATASMVHNATVDTELQFAFSGTGLIELKKIIDGTYSNNGWLIKADTEANDLWYFHSSDAATAGLRPKLVIEYSVAGGGFFF